MLIDQKSTSYRACTLLKNYLTVDKEYLICYQIMKEIDTTKSFCNYGNADSDSLNCTFIFAVHFLKENRNYFARKKTVYKTIQTANSSTQRMSRACIDEEWNPFDSEADIRRSAYRQYLKGAFRRFEFLLLGKARSFHSLHF